MAGYSNYGVPIMTFDDIIKTLKTRFEMIITKAELTNQAEPVVLQDVYHHLLYTLSETVDGLIQPRLSNHLDTTESMEGFIFLSNLNSALNTLLKKIGFHDLLFSDILQPKTKRTQTILSNLLNYHTFCVSQPELGDKLQSAMEDLLRAKETSAVEAPLLQRQIGDVTNEITLTKESIGKLENNAKEQRETLRDKLAVKEQAKKNKAALLAKIQELESKMVTCNEITVTLTTTEQALQERVAESPEEMERNLVIRGQELVQIKEEKRQMLARTEALGANETKYQQWEKTTAHLLKIVRNIKNEMERCRESEGQASVKERRRQELSEMLAEAVTKHTAHLNELVRLKELTQSLRVQQGAKVKNIQSRISDANKLKASFETNLNQNHVVIDGMIEQIKEMQQECLEIEKEIDTRQRAMGQFNKRCWEKLAEYHRQVAIYHEQLEKSVLAMVGKIQPLPSSLVND